LKFAKPIIYPRSAKFQRFSERRRVSPVALVHPVVVVSRVVAGWRVATVSPVLAMRWFSFVQ
jgi:hypothetical protein